MARLHPSEFGVRVAAWPRFARLLVPVALGVFAAIGHEDTGRGFAFVFIALVLAFLTIPVSRRSAAMFGWLFGSAYFAVTLRWLVEPFLVDPLRHGWMAPFAIFLMAGGLALFWALAFWGARWISGPRPSVILWAAVTLAATEMARGHIFTGFPWGLMSYVVIGQVADVVFAWVGPYGANFLLLIGAGAFAFGLYRGQTLIWPAGVAVLFALIGLQAITPQAPPPTDQIVRLVQPNAPQDQKWDPEWMGVFFDRALEQTGAGEAPDVVIWPETSVPTLLEYADPLIERMSLAARGAPVVAGVQRRAGDAFFNSAILIDNPDNISAISDKAHLVPFGEYIPFADWLEPMGLGTLVEQVAGFSPGQGDGLMEVAGLGVARVLICYEGIFPEEMQRGAVRPDVLLIITNDAWFGANAGPKQHLVQARARAIEQGLPVIRAANTGISAVIDARGTLVASLGLGQAGYLDAAVPAALPPTLYARVGDWPLVVLLVLLMIAGVARHRLIVIDQSQTRG